MNITAYQLAQRFTGIEEVQGGTANLKILNMLRLDAQWPTDDSVPWCSAFVNYIAWLLRLPRSKSLAARSWLEVGRAIPLAGAETGFDIMILKRGGDNQPGPEVIKAPGHVGFFAGRFIGANKVFILGGNQADSVGVAGYPEERVLGVRRLI